MHEATVVGLLGLCWSLTSAGPAHCNGCSVVEATACNKTWCQLLYSSHMWQLIMWTIDTIVRLLLAEPADLGCTCAGLCCSCAVGSLLLQRSRTPLRAVDLRGAWMVSPRKMG